MEYNELCACCADNRKKLNQLVQQLMDLIRKIKDKVSHEM